MSNQSITLSPSAYAIAGGPADVRKNLHDTPGGICGVAAELECYGQCQAKKMLNEDSSLTLSPNYCQPWGIGTVCARNHLINSK